MAKSRFTIDHIALACIVLIVLVCNIANLFVLKKPIYLLSSVPLIVFIAVVWKKLRIVGQGR